MVNQTPEQIARDTIDERLKKSGWVVQDKKKIDFSKGIGIAVREYVTDVGEVDYALFVDRIAVGVIEAKRDDEGHRITAVEEQSKGYADSKLKHLNNEPLPFRYEATGVLTRFTDVRDPAPRSREIFSFHRPESLQLMLKDGESFRSRLQQLPSLERTALRECQFRAINNLEKSFKAAKPRALVQMATGSGKTFTAITSVYRLLKFAKAKRVLFLVDTKNLGEQAEQEFLAYTPTDDNRKFTELYNVTRLKSKHVPPDSQVYISTIQRLFSALKGEDIDDSLEEVNPNERGDALKQPSDIAYTERLPIEFFDVIVVDECHRSIYNTWTQVIDYFDAFLVGLTATPDNRTFAFFKENVVSEYSHADAVADGVNVGFDVYVIETELTAGGVKRIQANEFVEKREKLSRKKRWSQVDEDTSYSKVELDREIVNPSQIRQVIKTFHAKLSEMFPSRKETPKTLIFAKTDSHADDIIGIVREEFGEGNEFCKKITYQADDPKSVLTSFRNDYNPRIAVTVDMIATGTDVRPLECLIFMRDVKSKNYYEQMLGRGTRILDEDRLRSITPSAKTAKTHFVVVDAIGVTKSQKTDTRPLDQKKGVGLKDLLDQVMMGSQEEAAFSSLASRLSRLDRELTSSQRDEFIRLSGGKAPAELVKDLFAVHDPDLLEELARTKFQIPEAEIPNDKQTKEIQSELARKAVATLNGDLNQFIVKARQALDQIIDTVNLDVVTYAGPAHDQTAKNQTLVTEFEAFINAHRDEITALKILFNEPHRRREITFRMITELYEKLKLNKPNLAPSRVFEAYAALEKSKARTPERELTAIVSLIRRITGVDLTLTDYESLVDRNFQNWVFRKQSGPLKFNEDQMSWLRMVKEHIKSSFHIEKEDLELSPFDSKGGLARMFDLFGNHMEPLIIEMNEALVA